MTDLERLAKTVLLFHRGGPWTPEDHEIWKELTGSPLATTRHLCDLARKVLKDDGSASPQAPNLPGEVLHVSSFKPGISKANPTGS